ncbi:MAG: LysR family transcriptional regulator [Bacteroidales bacterium]|nr:LysR family transcriptional regulator [Bacteroidales bacterium]MCF8345251.1 LysR family transcriptional regulator [Bacteroidales bacterium]MCF8352253.1 LysR family transcriptional regulator [Bacteroidales bacterium]MCF8376103.1 LysR family transcriptional regulator [Bacteroidales bacterium]MCF8401416.1 LysR family transcriptional regulator [Bacteroidales bacterium]
MKKKKDSSRYKNYLFNYKVWLSTITGQGIIDEDKYRILKLIKEKGSLKAAVKKVGVSYRKAWGDLKTAEEHLGYQIITKQRGGKEGGTTVLTSKGEKLIEAYEALQEKFDDSVEEAFAEFQRKIKENQ